MYHFHTDAGHGWLAVKIKELHELGLIHKISKYSYIRGLTAYLEEDCDMSAFIRAWQVKHGTYFDFKTMVKTSYRQHSPIRSYEHYSVWRAEEIVEKING